MHVDSHLSLPAAYQREARSELRQMRCRAYAHGARFPRAFRDSPTFRGAEAVGLEQRIVSERVWRVAPCKSEDGSVPSGSLYL